MSHPADHEDCPAVLRATADEVGVDIAIYTEPPTGPDPYRTDPFVCPHGQAFHPRPTDAQIAQWERDGTR